MAVPLYEVATRQSPLRGEDLRLPFVRTDMNAKNSPRSLMPAGKSHTHVVEKAKKERRPPRISYGHE